SLARFKRCCFFPCCADFRRPLAFDHQTRLYRRRVWMMKIPPTLFPDFGTPLPTFAVARKENLDCFSETRLTGSLSPNDERQARTRIERDALSAADPSKSLHGQRREISTAMRHLRLRARILLNGFRVGKVLLQHITAVPSREDSACPITLAESLGFETILNERAKVGVH